MTEEEAIEHVRWCNEVGILPRKEAIETVLNLLQTKQEEIEKKDKIIDLLKDEREYIKNNLRVDLNRKGIHSQTRGEISLILEHYESNDKYFKSKVGE